jgi:hypothetical protein
MSNEITYQIGIKRTDATNTLNAHVFPLWSKTCDQTLKRHYDNIVSVGTSEESIPFADISTNGFVIMLNLSTTNYVEWGTSTGDYPGKILAGESAGPFRLNAGKTLYAKANTGACDVRFIHYGG